jgi:GntR family transcriptional repressor for pyruvate dehydrogenase complex
MQQSFMGRTGADRAPARAMERGAGLCSLLPGIGPMTGPPPGPDTNQCVNEKVGNVSNSVGSQRPGFAPAKGRRAFDDIIEQLRERLRTDELRPGDRLPSERLMAEQFQVSRNTVREAMRMLEISGLIEIRKGATGGGFISHGDPGVVARTLTDMFSLSAFSLSDFTEVRLFLGSAVTRTACERATEEDLLALEDNVRRASSLTDAGDWESRALVNHEFLDLLAMATGNPVFVMLQSSITEMVRDIVSAVGPTRGEGILQSRRRLLTHLRARDADAACKEMETHLKKVHAVWLGARPVRGYNT